MLNKNTDQLKDCDVYIILLPHITLDDQQLYEFDLKISKYHCIIKNNKFILDAIKNKHSSRSENNLPDCINLTTDYPDLNGTVSITAANTSVSEYSPPKIIQGSIFLTKQEAKLAKLKLLYEMYDNFENILQDKKISANENSKKISQKGLKRLQKMKIADKIKKIYHTNPELLF